MFKEDTTQYCPMCEEWANKYDQLKEENIKFTLESKKLVARYSAKVERLEQTLAEIKEIAEKNDELLQGYHIEWANNKLIIQKISECEVKE